MSGWLEGRVTHNHQWSERLFSLMFDAPLDTFIPGQFVRVALDIDGEEVSRPYSLVNTPDEPELEIHFNIVPGGPLTPRLAKMQPGDEIKVAPRSFGFLTLDEIPDCRHLWMLATGTGIGPFLSILKGEQAWQRFEKIVLGYSVRTAGELSYLELINRICDNYQHRLSFVPFVTREPVPDSINSRITDAIRDNSFEQLTGISLNSEDSHVMMCGNSAMITEVSGLLEERGMRKHLRRKPGHITTEKYH